MKQNYRLMSKCRWCTWPSPNKYFPKENDISRTE